MDVQMEKFDYFIRKQYDMLKEQKKLSKKDRVIMLLDTIDNLGELENIVIKSHDQKDYEMAYDLKNIIDGAKWNRDEITEDLVSRFISDKEYVDGLEFVVLHIDESVERYICMLKI